MNPNHLAPDAEARMRALLNRVAAGEMGHLRSLRAAWRDGEASGDKELLHLLERAGELLLMAYAPEDQRYAASAYPEHARRCLDAVAKRREQP